MDVCTYRYPSRRNVVFGMNGMVCTSQPLAAQAGLEVLRKGGNAMDAAVATAACMTVLEPTSNGLGSDAFAIIYSATDHKLHGLNASGPAPMALDMERIRAWGTIPKRGWIPVTVPGAPGAWAAISSRFGHLPFQELFSGAIDYARNGYPLQPVTSQLWKESFDEFQRTLTDPCFQFWFETFATESGAPRAGSVVRLPDHARSLSMIAESNGESFYRGELAKRIDAFSRESGGYLRYEDLAAYHPHWVDPISADYRGCKVWEIPPNGHGIVALMALRMLSGFPFGERDTVDTLHWQIEALKLAFSDAKRYVADPRYMEVRVEELLGDDYMSRRRSLIGQQALDPKPGNPASGDTIYLCTADGEGNMVSYIQSNYMGFGSGLVVPHTGIALQNRGHNFTLDPAMENCMAPGKRPYHTIIPGFLTKNGIPVGPFGVMGGFMQPQGHLQVVTNMVDFAMNPQEALDAPRWQWTGGRRVEVEKAFRSEIIEGLRGRGHDIVVVPHGREMGRGQIIMRYGGSLMGATEPRADGMVAAY